MAEKKEEVDLIQTPTQVVMSYKLPDGNILNTDSHLLVWIANQLIEIRKKIG